MKLSVELTHEDEGFEQAFLTHHFDYEYGTLGPPKRKVWTEYHLDPKIKDPDRIILTNLMGCFALIPEEYERAICYRYGEVFVANYWDGDGTTVIYNRYEDVLLVNDDAKKSYGWEYNNDWWKDVIDDKSYYEPKAMYWL